MTQMPGHEWDETKRKLNLAKHGVDFRAMSAFEWDGAHEVFDNRHEEPRWIATGYIGLRLHVVAYTARDDIVRLISLRPARPREVRKHAKYGR